MSLHTEEAYGFENRRECPILCIVGIVAPPPPDSDQEQIVRVGGEKGGGRQENRREDKRKEEEKKREKEKEEEEGHQQEGCGRAWWGLPDKTKGIKAAPSCCWWACVTSQRKT